MLFRSPKNTPVSIQVLNNDVYALLTGVTLQTQADPAKGVATYNNNGTPLDPTDDYFVFTPANNYIGTATFTYTITDKLGQTDTATVTVTIFDPSNPTLNADLSVTICQIMGLRAARDAGLHVPDDVRTKCIEYVKKCQNADGGFRYQTTGSGGSTFALTAAGVVSLYSAGIYDGEPIEKALKWLLDHMPSKTTSNSNYFFYGQYYAVQAMWHAGGDYWDKWYPAIREILLARQAEDGSWPDAEVCPEFGTAMALIILQIPNNFLPIFAP